MDVPRPEGVDSIPPLMWIDKDQQVICKGTSSAEDILQIFRLTTHVWTEFRRFSSPSVFAPNADTKELAGSWFEPAAVLAFFWPLLQYSAACAQYCGLTRSINLITAGIRQSEHDPVRT